MQDAVLIAGKGYSHPIRGKESQPEEALSNHVGEEDLSKTRTIHMFDLRVRS
jgi:hypothetical protein